MDEPIPGFPRLTTNPLKLGGKPCVRGLRISVKDVLWALANYETSEELLADYPSLTKDDLVEVLNYAAMIVGEYEETRSCA